MRRAASELQSVPPREGVDDWVVLHGGATAVFRVGSLGEAARLAEAVAKTPGLAG